MNRIRRMVGQSADTGAPNRPLQTLATTLAACTLGVSAYGFASFTTPADGDACACKCHGKSAQPAPPVEAPVAYGFYYEVPSESPSEGNYFEYVEGIPSNGFYFEQKEGQSEGGEWRAHQEHVHGHHREPVVEGRHHQHGENPAAPAPKATYRWREHAVPHGEGSTWQADPREFEVRNERQVPGWSTSPPAPAPHKLREPIVWQYSHEKAPANSQYQEMVRGRYFQHPPHEHSEPIEPH